MLTCYPFRDNFSKIFGYYYPKRASAIRISGSSSVNYLNLNVIFGF